MKPPGLGPLAIWFRQMASLMNAGLPLLSCLQVCQVEHRGLNEATEDLRRLLSSGHRLSGAMDRHPEAFGFAVGLVRVGEESGKLVEVLDNLADYLESRLRLQRRMQSTLAYPAVLLGVSVVLLWALGSKLLPAMLPMFNQLGVPMPRFTTLVLGAVRFLSQPATLLGAIMLGLMGAILLRQLREADEESELRQRWDALVLRLPVAGPLLRKTIAARLTRMLGLALAVGLDLPTCLKLLRRVGGNTIVSARLDGALDLVMEGAPLSRALERQRVLTGPAVPLLGVGEETGKIPEMARRAADLLDEEVDLALAAAASLMEPLIVCGSSILVGIVAIASFLPWFELMAHLT